MDLGQENPHIGALYRAGTALTLKEFAERCERFLGELMSLHAGFAGLHLVQASSSAKGPAVSADVSNLRDWLLMHAWDKNVRNSYTARDEQGNPTFASTGRFRLSLSNWAAFDDKFDVSVSVGPQIRGLCEGSCTLVMPRKGHPEFIEGPLPLQLLEAVVKHWSIRHADFTTDGLLQRVNQSGERASWVGTITLGWLTYVDDPSVAEGLPPDIPVQRMDKGIVFKLADRMPDFNNPAHVAHALAVREALRSADKLRAD